MQSGECVRCSAARAGQWHSTDTLCWHNMPVGGLLGNLAPETLPEKSAAAGSSVKILGRRNMNCLNCKVLGYSFCFLSYL